MAKFLLTVTIMFGGSVSNAQYEHLFSNKDFVISKGGISKVRGTYQFHNNNIANGNGVVPGKGFHNDNFVNLAIEHSKGHRFSEGFLNRATGANRFSTAQVGEKGDVTSYTRCEGTTSEKKVLFNYWKYDCTTVTSYLCAKLGSKQEMDKIKKAVGECSAIAPIISLFPKNFFQCNSADNKLS